MPMLASSQFYGSDVFWAFTGVMVAIFAIITTVLLWYIGVPRRLLTYSLTSDTALLVGRAREQAGPDLTVSLHSEALTDPHVVSIRIENRSSRDIRGTDFEASKPLILDVGTPILEILDHSTGGTAMPEVHVRAAGNTISIGPALIKKRQVITMDLLTDAKTQIRCPNPPLADVTVKERRVEDGHPPKVSIITIIITSIGSAVLAGAAIVGVLWICVVSFFPPVPADSRLYPFQHAFLNGTITATVVIALFSATFFLIRRERNTQPK